VQPPRGGIRAGTSARPRANATRTCGASAVRSHRRSARDDLVGRDQRAARKPAGFRAPPHERAAMRAPRVRRQAPARRPAVTRGQARPRGTRPRAGRPAPRREPAGLRATRSCRRRATAGRRSKQRNAALRDWRIALTRVCRWPGHRTRPGSRSCRIAEGERFGRVGLRPGRLQLGEQRSQRNPLPIVLPVDGRVRYVRRMNSARNCARSGGVRSPMAVSAARSPPGRGTSETEVWAPAPVAPVEPRRTSCTEESGVWGVGAATSCHSVRVIPPTLQQADPESKSPDAGWRPADLWAGLVRRCLAAPGGRLFSAREFRLRGLSVRGTNGTSLERASSHQRIQADGRGAQARHRPH